MNGGVNFQPGQQTGNTQVRPKAGNSVQEAIKILSLRLPRQVGPNALAPAALLNAQGSGGNPRIDSVVSTVMGRMFPQGQPASQPQMGASGGPMASSGAPVLGPSPGENSPMPVSSPIRFDGNTQPPGNTPLSSMMPTAPPRATAPSVTFENPNPPNMNPNEWRSPAPPPPPGSTFDGSYTRWPDTPPTERAVGSPSEPTQDPWQDLMAYIRRKGDRSAPPIT